MPRHLPLRTVGKKRIHPQIAQPGLRPEPNLLAQRRETQRRKQPPLFLPRDPASRARHHCLFDKDLHWPVQKIRKCFSVVGSQQRRFRKETAAVRHLSLCSLSFLRKFLRTTGFGLQQKAALGTPWCNPIRPVRPVTQDILAARNEKRRKEGRTGCTNPSADSRAKPALSEVERAAKTAKFRGLPASALPYRLTEFRADSVLVGGQGAAGQASRARRQA